MENIQTLATADPAKLQQVLLDLLCQLAYREGDFILASGQRSSYYIDSKQVTLHPPGAIALGQLLLQLLPPDTQAVAGLTLGADPLVTAVSVVGVYENRAIAALIVRKEPKGHGTRAYLEGPELSPGSTVVVLEDVVTTGQSALKAVGHLRQAGYTVHQVVALVDRQEGAAELYQQQGLAFQALYTIDVIQTRWRQLQD